jgi:hypothetical protein
MEVGTRCGVFRCRFRYGGATKIVAFSPSGLLHATKHGCGSTRGQHTMAALKPIAPPVPVRRAAAVAGPCLLVLQAQNIGRHVPEFLGLKHDIGHGRMRAGHPRKQRHLGDAKCIGNVFKRQWHRVLERQRIRLQCPTSASRGRCRSSGRVSGKGSRHRYCACAGTQAIWPASSHGSHAESGFRSR